MSYGISISGDTKVVVNSITPAKKLRFLGAGVSVVDNPSNGTFDITIGGGGSGTIDTVVNVGSGTGTVFRDIISTTINLKSIAPGSTKLAVTNNANDITLDVAEANLNIANQSGSIGNARITDLAYSKLSSVPTTFAPSAHKTSHQSGGSDSIALDTLAATTDITTLNSSTSAHGLLRKLDNNSAHFLDGTGGWTTPSSGTGTPIAKGTASKNGDSSTKVFTIAHSMSTLPVYADVTPTSTDALGSYVITMDATNITITYQIAPPTGTGNLTYEWIAMDVNGGGGAGLPAGEANTASNAGTGSGWFKAKTGVDLAFKSLVLGSTKLTVTSNVSDLTLDVTEANLTLSNLGGSVTKAQIPGTAVYTDQTNTYGAFAQIYPTSQLKILNPAATFNYIIASAAIAANRTLTLPLLTGNDTVVTEAFAQTLTNKTIAVGSNTVTGIVDANIGTHTTSKISTTTKALLNSAIVYNDQTNTFGAFAQLFPTSQLKLLNPAATFSYIMATSAIAADRTVTWPLLTGNDQVTMDAFSTSLTNKTIVAASNTFTDTSAVLGDILKHNGTKFVRLARGSANQVLAVNSGGTDIAWAPATGGFTETKGTSTQSGNASTVAFTIAHGLAGTPTFATAVAQSTDSDDDFYVTVDGTNITITYPFAPPTGTSNLIWFWRAAL